MFQLLYTKLTRTSLDDHRPWDAVQTFNQKRRPAHSCLMNVDSGIVLALQQACCCCGCKLTNMRGCLAIPGAKLRALSSVTCLTTVVSGGVPERRLTTLLNDDISRPNNDTIFAKLNVHPQSKRRDSATLDHYGVARALQQHSTQQLEPPSEMRPAKRVPYFSVN